MIRGATKGLDVILDEEEDQDQDGEPSHDTHEDKRVERNGSICFFGIDDIMEDDEESS